jgi:hypothetical protein
MPSFKDFAESKYLKKEDVDPAVLVTLNRLTKDNVAGDGQPPEYKAVAFFSELAKPMIVNWTNLQLMAQVFGSEDTDHWIGKPIVLFNDPSIQYQGKLTGGIRVRAPRVPQNRPASYQPPAYQQPAPAYAPPTAPPPPQPQPGPPPGEFDDECPF